MTEAELADFEQRLKGLAAALLSLQEASLDGTRTVELDQSCTGRLTRMDAMQAQQMNLASQSRRSRQLRQIESALRRIELGAYGRCIECDEWIDPRRLDLDPSLPTCVQCAQ